MVNAYLTLKEMEFDPSSREQSWTSTKLVLVLVLNNFCAVSNIVFLRMQPQMILEEVDNLDLLQSGFRAGYSPEMGLILLKDNVHWAQDGDSVWSSLISQWLFKSLIIVSFWTI